MYKTVKWSPQSPLTSASLMQMVENDKENYLSSLYGAGPVLALSVMTQRFESMPGSNPVRIPALSVDAFRAPYSGWYKAHFSCQAAKQEVTNTQPSNPTAGSLILDGFYFLITCKRSSRAVESSKYDTITGQSLFDVQQLGSSPYLGNIISRASFVRSGCSVPAAATGYTWLERGENVSWHVYTYVANNNYDLYGTDQRWYGRIIMNDIKPSDTKMGYGSPRTYTPGTTPGVDITSGISNDTVAARNTISNIATPNDNPLRSSFLMVQFCGQGGMPDLAYTTNIEKSMFSELQQSYSGNPSEL